MKITLIVPGWDVHSFWRIKPFRFPLLCLSTLAALTPERHELELVDENVEELDYDSLEADLVGITAMTAQAPRAYAIAGLLRERGIKTVLGGIHPTMMPDEAMQHADAIVLGEAEGLWPQLLEDCEQGRLKRRYGSDARPSLEHLPAPRRELYLKNRRYKRYYMSIDTLQTGRGCPFGCDFCSVTQFSGNTYRFRPIEDVVRELSAMKSKLIMFMDDNIVGNPKHARELFKAIAPLHKRWFSQCSLNIANDDALLKCAAESGCDELFIGFETLSIEGLQEMHKKQNINIDYKKAVMKLHDYGISVFGAFIFGFEHDDNASIQRTLDFTNECDMEDAQFSILTPFPGTSLFATMKAQERITTYDWSQYDFSHLVFQHNNFTKEELEDKHLTAWKDFYSLKSIFTRLVPKKLISWYLVENLTFGYHSQKIHRYRYKGT
jgi:radical SAM superfamily enzyme YgiQ (UPF0313 family)